MRMFIILSKNGRCKLLFGEDRLVINHNLIFPGFNPRLPYILNLITSLGTRVARRRVRGVYKISANTVTSDD